MFLHHEIRKSSVGGVNRKNLSGFCIRGGGPVGILHPLHISLSNFIFYSDRGRGNDDFSGKPVGILHTEWRPVGILHTQKKSEKNTCRDFASTCRDFAHEVFVFRKWKPFPPASPHSLRSC